MTYRFIMSDIDGTFFNSQKHIPQSTKDICARLYHEKGVKIALASGRGVGGIEVVEKELGLPVYILACNGAEAYDEQRNLLFRKTLPFADALAIKRAVREINPAVETITYAGLDWVADEMTDIVRGECYVMPTKPIIGALDKVVSADTPILKIICVGTVEETAALQDILRERFPQYDFYKSQKYILEVVAKDVDKSAGLKLLCDKLHIDIAETIAFGDSFNDVKMLRAAGLGIAMGNAADDAKAAADKITDTNDNDGIAKALNEIFY